MTETISKPAHKHSDINVKEVVSHCADYKGADNKRSALQLITTLTLLAALCVLMYYSMNVSYFFNILH